jgi:hypothetical protein
LRLRKIVLGIVETGDEDVIATVTLRIRRRDGEFKQSGNLRAQIYLGGRLSTHNSTAVTLPPSDRTFVDGLWRGCVGFEIVDAAHGERADAITPGIPGDHQDINDLPSLAIGSEWSYVRMAADF